VLFPIGFFWCVISPRRHSVQDIAVYSAVTYDWMPHPGPQPAAAVPPHVAQQAPAVPLPVAQTESAVEPSRTEPGLPASGSPASEAPAAPEPQTRRYRWARAIDPYDG
jgi:hypothetical protein